MQASLKRLIFGAGAVLTASGAVGGLSGQEWFSPLEYPKAARDVPGVAAENEGPDAPHLKPKVVIVGAGIAGMIAAYELKNEYGLESEVYEAKDRVGGRAWSINGPAGSSHKVELGGSFINTTDTVLRGVIKKLGLTEVQVPSKKDIRYLLKTAEGGYEAVTQKFLYQKFQATLARIKKGQEELGIGDDDRETASLVTSPELDAMTLQDYLKSIEAPAEFSDYIQAHYGSDYGRPIRELNALHLVTEIRIDPVKEEFWFTEEKLADESLAIKEGNQAVAIEAEKRLKNVRKNHILEAIDSSNQKKFKLTFNTPNGKETVTADYVVVTVPFPVLREKIQLRIKDFPEKVSSVIKGMVHGQNPKMILQFQSPLWRTQYRHSGTVQTPRFMTWDNDASLTGAQGSLTVLFHGEEALSDQTVGEVLDMMENVYPGIRGQFIGRDMADWPRDPYSRGSFSGAKIPGQWAVGWPTAESLRVGHLIFAGEHLGGEGSAGYMNGAAQSGQDAAEIIAEMAKTAEPQPSPLSLK